MNTNNVKKYAPKARKAFIEAMSKQAAKYGITKKKIEPAEQKGDLVLIGDRPFPASVIKPRERLVKRIEQQGFDQVMEHVAYSWFNRLCAIRYMERKGFLDHGRRVLSAADGSASVPQILEECLDVELPGLDQAKVRELKLDGTKDEELYRELLLAQCHALHQAMPFLFEAVADESELLLPENLTKTDSLIRDLVASVPDEDWDHIEIIGWLYQFYISEKKDQVIGKVVKNEDIPAATQLFTPNWIVQYLVQNSVGRQWLQTYPDSPLKEKMPYYIELSEQALEVQDRLAEMSKKEIKPELLSCLDPSCGSGHILVEAYKLFKAIYEERGYRTRDIPQLILENNLYGLDIDDRAGQLAGFALMMLAREDDRRIFARNIRLNVLSLQDSTSVNLLSLWQSLNLTGDWESGSSQGLFGEEQQDLGSFTSDNRYELLKRTLERFKQSKTFGSLIEVPHEDLEGLTELHLSLAEMEQSGDTMQKVAASQLLPFVHQSLLLAREYDSVITNPPYIGSGYLNADLKELANIRYVKSKADLFGMFIERCIELAKPHGFSSMMTPFTWLTIKNFSELRKHVVATTEIVGLVQPEYHAFFESAYVPICAYILRKSKTGVRGCYIDLADFYGAEIQPVMYLKAARDVSVSYRYDRCSSDFSKVPDSSIMFKLPDPLFDLFSNTKKLAGRADISEGIKTGDNEYFIRFWHEVDYSRMSTNGGGDDIKWIPHHKGGEYRRWYGNLEHVVNWENNGAELKSSKKSGLQGSKNYFNEGVTWSKLSSSYFGVRMLPENVLFDSGSPSAFIHNESERYALLGYLSSVVASYIVKQLNPTLNFQVGNIASLPFKGSDEADYKEVNSVVKRLVELAKTSWDYSEVSYSFNRSPILNGETIRQGYSEFILQVGREVDESVALEVVNNKSFVDIYDLNGFLDTDVLREDITHRYNPEFIYDSKKDSGELSNRLQSDILKEFLSYTVGCMVGRYSLDRDGLVYARSGNSGFTELVSDGAYKTFPADDDGIIPLTDQEWFPDDATNRFREFVKVVWGEDRFQENLDFVAESLCLHAIKPKKSESSMDTIRRYLSTQFYKDHLKTYKKRPIYWLFSSGKQKAFECLVYLHRYNEGTLARMRTEYVIPLTAKMAAYAQKLENDKEASGSAAEVKRLEKEIAQLHKQQAELSEFDEKLRHYADQRISLNLDDGVKVNYGKFGDLLAEVKAITGDAPEVLS